MSAVPQAIVGGGRLQLAACRPTTEHHRRTGALDPNRPDTSDGNWGVNIVQAIARKRIGSVRFESALSLTILPHPWPILLPRRNQ